MGEYPIEAVAMLARFAAAIEPHRAVYSSRPVLQTSREDDQIKIENLIASSVETTLDRITPGTVIVPPQRRHRKKYYPFQASRYFLTTYQLF